MPAVKEESSLSIKTRLLSTNRWNHFIKSREKMYRCGWPAGKETTNKLAMFYPDSDPERVITDTELQELGVNPDQTITHAELKRRRPNNKQRRDAGEPELKPPVSRAKIAEAIVKVSAGTESIPDADTLFDFPADVDSPAPEAATPRETDKASWNEVVQYVFNNAYNDQARKEDAPTAGAWGWLIEVKTNPDVAKTFFTQIIPRLFSKEMPNEEQEFQDAARTAKDAIRRCLAEIA